MLIELQLPALVFIALEPYSVDDNSNGCSWLFDFAISRMGAGWSSCSLNLPVALFSRFNSSSSSVSFFQFYFLLQLMLDESSVLFPLKSLYSYDATRCLPFRVVSSFCCLLIPFYGCSTFPLYLLPLLAFVSQIHSHPHLLANSLHWGICAVVLLMRLHEPR